MRYTSVSVSERRTLPPAIAVSTVAFAVSPPSDAYIGSSRGLEPVLVDPASEEHPASDETTLWIPLVRRTREPFLGAWALPGGPTEWNETLTDTALRTVHDAVRRGPSYLEQLYAFGAVERSADAQRLVTIAYWAQYGERDVDAAPTFAPVAHATSDERPRKRRWDDVHEAHSTPISEGDSLFSGSGREGDPSEPDPNVAWFSADELPPLAFDHAEIVQYALWRLRIKTEYSSVAHRFLGPEFTLSQLRRVHEAILGNAVDPANFRRQMLASGTLIDTNELLTGSAHRPARLYRFRDTPERSPDHPSRAHNARSRQ